MEHLFNTYGNPMDDYGFLGKSDSSVFHEWCTSMNAYGGNDVEWTAVEQDV